MNDLFEPTLPLEDPRVASAFDEVSLWSARFGDLLFRHLDLRPGLTILDLATGTGFPLLELAHVHGPSSRLFGVDPWAEALKRARAKVRAHGVNHAHLIRGDGVSLPFGPAAFDLIVCHLGINNFEDPAGVLAECARVARRGARIVITTNVVGHMQEFYDVFRETLATHNPPGWMERLKINEDHRLSREVIGGMLEQAGFDVSRVFEDQFNLRFLDGSALFRHRLVRYGFLDGWRRVAGPSDEERIFAEMEERLNVLARKRGSLSFSVPMLYIEGTRREGDK